MRLGLNADPRAWTPVDFGDVLHEARADFVVFPFVLGFDYEPYKGPCLVAGVEMVPILVRESMRGEITGESPRTPTVPGTSGGKVMRFDASGKWIP